MKLSALKSALNNLESLTFKLPNGVSVPSHFHVTEVGEVNRKFIDCGGTLRNDTVINFQLWTSHDYDHRLAVDKLQSIINLAESKLDLADSDIEVEYQGETIGKFGLEVNDNVLQLTSTSTACLAEDACGITPANEPVESESSCCTPSSGCC
jgi:hypothetical protein